MEQDVESESFEQDLLHGSLEDFQLHGDQLANYSESTWQHPWFPWHVIGGRSCCSLCVDDLLWEGTTIHSPVQLQFIIRLILCVDSM